MASIPIGAESRCPIFDERIYATWNAKKSNEKMTMISLNVFCFILYQNKNAKTEYSKKV
jgi:hypothetical protein